MKLIRNISRILNRHRRNIPVVRVPTSYFSAVMDTSIYCTKGHTIDLVSSHRWHEQYVVKWLESSSVTPLKMPISVKLEAKTPRLRALGPPAVQA